jgi:hypothetical protein
MVVSTTNQVSLPNGVACNESTFAAEMVLSVANQHLMLKLCSLK